MEDRRISGLNEVKIFFVVEQGNEVVKGCKLRLWYAHLKFPRGSFSLKLQDLEKQLFSPGGHEAGVLGYMSEDISVSYQTLEKRLPCLEV